MFIAPINTGTDGVWGGLVNDIGYADDLVVC